MKEIKLTRGKVTLVDDDIFEQISNLKWQVSTNGYAIRNTWKKVTYLHRVIMKPPKGQIVDHISGNKLDNRRINLRLCTYAGNNRNKHKSKNKSGYKGVFWDNRNNTWYARLNNGGQLIYGGYFLDKKEAAKKYNEIAVTYFKEFAHLNTV